MTKSENKIAKALSDICGAYCQNYDSEEFAGVLANAVKYIANAMNVSDRRTFYHVSCDGWCIALQHLGFKYDEDLNEIEWKLVR